MPIRFLCYGQWDPHQWLRGKVGRQLQHALTGGQYLEDSSKRRRSLPRSLFESALVRISVSPGFYRLPDRQLQQNGDWSSRLDEYDGRNLPFEGRCTKLPKESQSGLQAPVSVEIGRNADNLHSSVDDAARDTHKSFVMASTRN